MKKIIFLILVATMLLLIASCGEHTHVSEVIPRQEPTCTQVGYSEWEKCKDCGEVLVAKRELPASHKEKVSLAVEATCTKDGVSEGRSCMRCGEVISVAEVIPAHHTIEILEGVNPEIGKDGLTEGQKCTACDQVLVEQKVITLLDIEVFSEESSKGMLSCVLTLKDVKGEFNFYFADENKVKLDYFDELLTTKSTTDYNIYEFDSLVIPKGSEYIIATNDEEYVYFVELPDEYLLGEKNFTFGSLSDVHINRGNYLDGALDFFDEYGEMDFVAISGDISDGDEDDMKMYNSTISSREYKTYTTTGNHDTHAVSNGDWKKLMNTAIKKDTEVSDIGENGMDFVYTPEKNPDTVFVFLSQTYWAYSTSPSSKQFTILTEKQLTWLETVLEKYKDKTVCLYFHTFLASPDGDQEDAVGNIKNEEGYSYGLYYSYGAGDEIKFRSLLQQYKNVIFFSGHSHWMFELEEMNENLNVSNFDGEYCYMVHNPSVCSPRWAGEYSKDRTELTGDQSEGWIVEVYDDVMVLIPVEFMSQTFYTEYMKIIPLTVSDTIVDTEIAE